MQGVTGRRTVSRLIVDFPQASNNLKNYVIYTFKDSEYHSKLFLDCCGLVRRIMRDLEDEFGFRIGSWNQAYQHDTLPITVEREEDMKPGDLVFISAVYYNEKMKKQRHNLTHVEIWLGEGRKTIGSRWHKGHVGIFDDYRFKSTSYHSMKYIFKSIDTWLMGICRSHCPDHKWKNRNETYKSTKKSIFKIQDGQLKKKNKSKKKASTEISNNCLDQLNLKPLPPIQVKKETNTLSDSTLPESLKQTESKSVEQDNDEEIDLISSGSCTEASQIEDDDYDLEKENIKVEIMSSANCSSVKSSTADSEKENIEVEVLSTTSSGSSVKLLGESTRPSSYTSFKLDLQKDMKLVSKTLERLEVSGRQLVAPSFYMGRPKTTPESSKHSFPSGCQSFSRGNGNNLLVIKSYSAPTSRSQLETVMGRRASDSNVLKKKYSDRHTKCHKAEKIVGKSARSDSMENTLSVKPSSFSSRQNPEID
ncbi:DgyrCDS4455 [Dimorphilus gyrociliatus]|uniref:DgyrCDS4455 n=1 Tax=Dimorphilus gyrociliatus TaxID=2664684 RepID=A0A7I8VGL5_9ANNE|nr:DgyrCDS4455 [Dimorphilus gyrociliatus]